MGLRASILSFVQSVIHVAKDWVAQAAAHTSPLFGIGTDTEIPVKNESLKAANP